MVVSISEFIRLLPIATWFLFIDINMHVFATHIQQYDTDKLWMCEYKL